MPQMLPFPDTGDYITRTLNQFQGSADEAKQANLGRYGDILNLYNTLVNKGRRAVEGIPQMYQNIADQYGQRVQDLGGLLKGFGDPQRQDLKERFAEDISQVPQDYINRGLANFTMLAGRKDRVKSNYEKERRALEDSLTRQQMDYMSALTGQHLAAQSMVPQATLGTAQQQFAQGERPLQFMERRNDVGPSLQEAYSFGSTVGAGSAPIPNYQGMVQQAQRTARDIRPTILGAGTALDPSGSQGSYYNWRGR